MINEITATHERLQTRRVVAIGRSLNGGAFKVMAPVQPPADFSEAVAEVDSRTPVYEWRDHDVIDDEIIGEEISRTPFLY